MHNHAMPLFARIILYYDTNRHDCMHASLVPRPLHAMTVPIIMYMILEFGSVGNLEVVSYLTKLQKCDVNCITNEEQTPLHVACR